MALSGLPVLTAIATGKPKIPVDYYDCNQRRIWLLSGRKTVNRNRPQQDVVFGVPRWPLFPSQIQNTLDAQLGFRARRILSRLSDIFRDELFTIGNLPFDFQFRDHGPVLNIRGATPLFGRFTDLDAQ